MKKTLVALAVFSAVTTAQAQMVGNITVEQWQKTNILDRGGVLAAWNRGITGQGSIVAVVDQGFDQTHTDLKGQIIGFKNFQGGRVQDWGLHGTQMASIIAGANNGSGMVGVAPDAKLLLAQVGSGGTTTNINMAAVRSAMTWADTQGAHVVNLSLSSNYDTIFQRGMKQISTGVWQAPANYGSMYGNRQSDLLSFANANKNSVIVAAAGNQGLAYAAFPAAFATQVDANGNLIMGGRTLIVGSVNLDNSISKFSNRAGHICTNLSGTTCKDPYQVKDFYVVAPGEKVFADVPNQLKAGNTVNMVSGTSVAAAYVSGGMALMKQAWPQLRAGQMVSIVLDTTTDLGAKGIDEVYGRGMVNFDKATQPQGTLVYTTASLGGGAAKGTVVAAGGTITGGTAQALKTSSVLQNVQVVDGYNRNYAANFTKTFNTANPANSLYASPFLAVNPVGYQELKANVDRNTTMMVMKSDLGLATQFDIARGANTYSFQIGSMSEQNGFLNNYSQGLAGFGNSRTTWLMGGVEHSLQEKTSVIFGYGIGVSETGSAANSIVQLSNQIVSDTWKLGLAQKNVFLADKSSDTLSLSLQGPVAVRQGSAKVTAVTGYSYSQDADGEITANPITESERVNLRATTRQMDLVLGYSADIKSTQQVAVNLMRQFNVGGESGVNGSAVAIKYTAKF